MQSIPSRSDLYIVTARVRQYQRLSETPVKAWVAVELVGTVLCVHCTCMAGLGEVCSHVAAILFTIDANTQLKNNTASTSLPCSWLPPTFQHVIYSEFVDIDFFSIPTLYNLYVNHCNSLLAQAVVIAILIPVLRLQVHHIPVHHT